MAHKLADVSGWRLLDLTVPADWDRQLPEMLPTALAWADGNLEVLELAWVLWAHKQMSSTHGSLLIGGGGEHLRGFAWHQEFLQAGKSDRVNLDNWLDMRMLHPMDVTLFKSDPTPAVRDDQRARIVRWAEPYASEVGHPAGCNRVQDHGPLRNVSLCRCVLPGSRAPLLLQAGVHDGLLDRLPAPFEPPAHETDDLAPRSAVGPRGDIHGRTG